MQTESPLRICLWSGPRNISTALMYSFAQRSDTVVYDEPLYAHYLSNSDAARYHPGAEETLASMDNDGNRVVRELVLGDQPKPVAFFKMMTHFLVELDQAFLSKTVNVLLTRDPWDMLPSYAQQIPNPVMADVGYAQHLDLLSHLRSLGQEPPVLDAYETLKNPRLVLTQLCERIGIEFQDSMLSWEPGARLEDGSWAKYWYANVHRSSGFNAAKKRTEPLPKTLQPLYDAAKPFYDELHTLSIKAGP